MKLKKEITFDQVTTRGGDRGESTLYNGERRRKDDSIFEALGDLDELTSFLGLAKAGIKESSFYSSRNNKMTSWLNALEQIQTDLVILGGMVANPDNRNDLKGRSIGDQQIEYLEKEQKKMMDSITIPREFIHPGKTLASSRIDLARAVCRKSERRVVRCIRENVMNHVIPCQVYLNRLSDFLFISARYWESLEEG